jgi:hypothetical protein
MCIGSPLNWCTVQRERPLTTLPFLDSMNIVK